jgi:TetR/AcrR family transcriptional repressor of nem operon
MGWQKQFDEEEVLHKAMKAFWSRGYAATSVQDLVRSMGINKGSIYGTYGNKRSLFMKALQLYNNKRKALLAGLETSQSAISAIRGLFQSRIDEIFSDSERLGCFLTNTALELAAHDAEIRDMVAQRQMEIEGFFQRMIERGQADKEISENLDAASASQSLLASLFGIMVLSRSRPEPALLTSIADSAVAILK